MIRGGIADGSDGGEFAVGSGAYDVLRPLKVGITGGIGSGKSLVCELFAALGVPVYNSDLRARELVNGPADSRRLQDGVGRQNEADMQASASEAPGGIVLRSDNLRARITALLGEDAYRDDRLDREFVASKVFTNKVLLASLNAIIHPAVAEDFEAWALGRAASPYVILESAILFESGFDRFVDKIITVSAPEDLRLERVLGRGASASARDGRVANDEGCTEARPTREQILDRMANQLTDSERELRADYTIDNSGTLEKLKSQVEKLGKLLRKSYGKP